MLGTTEKPLTPAGNPSRAEYYREYRRRKSAEKPPEHRIRVEKAVRWIERTLKVPTGPLAGRPFRVPTWQRDWLVDAAAPGIRESGLSVARKNGKSGLIAAYLLAHLVGPLVARDWRCVVSSLTGPLAAELRDAIVATAKASALDQSIQVRRAPPPGRIFGKEGTRIDFLAADKATGHALGADLAILDEAGLLLENARFLWNALFTSISGRDGRMWAISVQGEGPMFTELEQRAGSPSVHWVKYTAPNQCDLRDVDAWTAANPGIADGIKSHAYMEDAAERAVTSPGNESHFRAWDLNQPVDPEREMIVTVSNYAKCLDKDAPSPSKDMVVGIDLGGTASMTCAVAYSPHDYTMLVRGAFGDDPPLSVRGRKDRLGTLYDRMIREGELRLYPGSVVPIADFLRDVFYEFTDLGNIIAIGADRYRRREVESFMRDAGLPIYARHWRGTGAGATADGSHDIRAFQRAILERKIRMRPSTMLESAIASSMLRFDKAGNPALDKASGNARIDALSAAVIALGIAEGITDAPLFKVHVA